MAEQPAPMLLSCVYSIDGGLENEDYTYTIRLHDSPEMALLTMAKRDGFEAYSLPRKVLDGLAEPWLRTIPQAGHCFRNEMHLPLDVSVRRIELVYVDGSEYTLCDDRETDGPIFADAETFS